MAYEEGEDLLRKARICAVRSAGFSNGGRRSQLSAR
jgi:hypothetical protein